MKMKAQEWKCGLSTNASRVTKETFDGYARAGIQCMEFSVGTIGDDKDTDYKLLKKYALDSGTELWSYHLPFAPFDRMNIASLDGDFRRKSVEITKEFIDKAASLEIKTAVIHPSAEPNAESDRPEHMKSAKESLAELAEYAAKSGITIAVEDLPRTCLGNCSDDILELISADERLRVCFDSNHLLKQRNEEFVKAVGDKIITTHISDYDFRNERHWLPYEGRIDWRGLVSALEEVGFSGPFLFEISVDAPQSISRRRIEYEDFYANYKACVNKESFGIFGTPNEEVCAASAFYKTPIIEA